MLGQRVLVRRPSFAGSLVAALIFAGSLTPAAAATPLTAPGAPVIIGPDGGATGVNPEFVWSEVSGARSYRVWIDVPLSTGNPPVETVNTRLTDVLFQSATHVDWSVAAVDADGNEGPKSSASFDVGPLVPSLVAPADGTTFSYPDDSPSIQWRPAYDGGAALYYLDSRIGQGAIPDLAGLAANRVEIGGAPGTWRWTAGQVITPPPGTALVRTFTVLWPNSTPALIAPADGAAVASTAPALSWSAINGASGYDIQLDDDAGFGSPIAMTNIRLATSPVSGLASGTWHWRVRAREPHDGTGAWSSARSFMVPVVGVPAIIGPADGATLTEYPALTWQPSAGATGYDVEVGPSTTDSSIQPIRVDGTAFISGPPGWASFGPFPFGPGPQAMVWRVRAAFPLGGFVSGDTTAWSAWRTFTVDPPNSPALGSPTVPTLVAPATCGDLATCPTHPASPILDWNPVDGAAFYRVFFQHGGDGTGPWNSSYDTAGSTYLDRFPSSTSGIVGWGVIACATVPSCPTELASLPRRYVVDTPAPAVVGPSDGSHLENSAALLTWTPAAIDSTVPTTPIGFYEIGLKTLINGTWSPWQPQIVPGSQTSFALTGIQIGASWQWQVRALPVTGGLPSPWSAWRTLDRPAVAPTITSPSDGATVTSTPHLAWTAATGTSAGNRVDIVRGNPASPSDWAGLQQWHFDVVGRSLDVFPELAPGAYTWRVSEAGADLVDPTGSTAIGHFVVPAAAPLTLLAPAAGSSIPDDRGVFTWQAVQGAADYRVDVATDPDFAPEHIVDHGDAWGTIWAMRRRLPAGSIYWRVTAFAPGYQVIGTGQADFAIGTSGPRLAISVATVVDTVAPDVSAPVQRVAVAPLRAGAVPIQLSWAGSDASSGVDHYLLSEQSDGGTWSAPMSVAGPSITSNLRVGHLYRFRVQAVDHAANISAWAYGSSFRLTAIADGSASVRYRGTWASSANVAMWWGGTARFASTAGATASLTFTGRSIAWVSLKAATRGQAQVFVNGVLKATVDLSSPTTLKQRVIWSAQYPTSATRTITIKVLGTSGRPRVDLDGFVVAS